MIQAGEMEPYPLGPQHGPKMVNLEAKLGPSWPQDRILEAKLGPSWLQDRPWGGQVGSKLAPTSDFRRSETAS